MAEKAWLDWLNYLYREKVKKCTLCQGKDIECACMVLYERQVTACQAGIPFQFKSADLTKIANEEDRLEINKVILRFKEMYAKGVGVAISGKTGSGRTLALCVVGNHAIANGYITKYFSMKDMVEVLGKGWQKPELSEKFVVEMVEPQVLLIDDVAADVALEKPFTRMCFETILTRRINNVKPTCITLAAKRNIAESSVKPSIRTLEDLQDTYPEIYGQLYHKAIPICLQNFDYYKKLGEDLVSWWNV